MGGTTVDDTTGGPGGDIVEPGADAISDGDLPTRMLVLGVARHDGTIPAADAFAVAEACHRSPEQVRSCLRRLVGEGLFVREGVGQRALYQPTEEGLRALGAFATRTVQAHVQDAARDHWDGRWHLVAFAIPEARRSARDALRDHLGLLGGAAIHNGLYVSPHPWDKDVLDTARRLDVADHVILAVTDDLAVGGESDPTALAARLWPLAELAGRYRAFVERWSVVLDHLGALRHRDEELPDSALLPGALAMGLAYRECFDRDPLLPADLLPQPWPGREARDLLLSSRRLAQQVRADSGRVALFATFHDLVDSLPPGASRPDTGGQP